MLSVEVYLLKMLNVIQLYVIMLSVITKSRGAIFTASINTDSQ